MEYQFRAWRHHKLLTLLEVANKAGIREATLSVIERGLQRPSPPTVLSVAAALGISVRRLRNGPPRTQRKKAARNHLANATERKP